MATFKIVAVRDRQLDAFNQPFFTPALGGAIRAFGDEINKPGTPANAHPEDYDLYELGEYNDADGSFTTHRPKQIAVGTNFIATRQ